MSTRQRGCVVAIIITLFVISGGGYAYWFFLIQGPLAGETSFDFGDVPLHGENAEIEHILQLFNRLNHPITIHAVRPDCGCLTTERDPRATLQPGEGFDLPVTMVAKPGPRTVLIQVDLGDDGVQTLRVKATGKPQTRLLIAQPVALLKPGATAEIEFSALTYDTQDEPPVPVIAAEPAGLVADFVGWSLGYRPKDVSVSPTEWRGRLRVRYVRVGIGGPIGPAEEENAWAVPAGASIQVSLHPSKPLTIAILRMANDKQDSVQP